MRPEQTVMRETLARAGIDSGYRALRYMARWAIMEAKLGRSVQLPDEYAREYGLSRSQAFREQAFFRLLLPEYRTPGAMLAEMDAQVSRSIAQAVAELPGTNECEAAVLESIAQAEFPRAAA